MERHFDVRCLPRKISGRNDRLCRTHERKDVGRCGYGSSVKMIDVRLLSVSGNGNQ